MDTPNTPRKIRYGSLGNDIKENKDEITPAMLEKLRMGDHVIFERIYLKYSLNITKLISAMIRSFEDAEELTQEIFTSLWQGREKVDPQKSISGYLYTSARFQILNYLRAKSVRVSYANDFVATSTESFSSEETIYAREVQLLINLTVSKMPKQRKKIFELSRNEGLSNDEIARILGITKNAVERHLTFALRDLREVLTLLSILLMLGQQDF